MKIFKILNNYYLELIIFIILAIEILIKKYLLKIIAKHFQYYPSFQ
jgi:hypothetical protein